MTQPFASNHYFEKSIFGSRIGSLYKVIVTHHLNLKVFSFMILTILFRLSGTDRSELPILVSISAALSA